MRSVTYAQIAEWTDGGLIQGSPSELVSHVVTDSRKVENGDLFVALKGDRFDAHEFLEDVAQRGAGGLLVAQLPPATEGYSGAIVHVKDTLQALQRLAFFHRRHSEGLRVIGVTGSNGKTSTKDFLSAVLSVSGTVNKTAGNLNNHIGLPLTILSGSGEDRFGVWEMGMNHSGEIEVLAEIAAPDAAVITNIGTAHIEHLKTRDAIALEKSELAMAVSRSGYCAMPVADDYYGFVSDRVDCEVVAVGIEEGQVQARDLSIGEEGRARFELASDFGSAASVSLPVMGRHMVTNSLLAAAVGLKEGLSPADIAEALSGVSLTGGRLQETKVGDLAFLDDSYNANPDSMRAAIATLNEAPVSGRRIAVLGFMGELGEHEESEHRSLGEVASASGLDAVFTVGERAAQIDAGVAEGIEHRNFSNHEEAAEFLRDYLTPGDLTLVKGSRAAAMEQIIRALEQG